MRARPPQCNGCLVSSCCTRQRRRDSSLVLPAWKKIEVDPVKFAADLESYEDLKRRLVLDTASFGVVGALVTFEVLYGLWSISENSLYFY